MHNMSSLDPAFAGQTSDLADPLSLNGSSGMNSSDGDFLYDAYSWSSDLMMRHSPAVSSIYCVAYTVVFAMGIIGNSCVVAVVLRSPRMRTVTNYFIVNLACADILVLLFCLPATLLSNLFIRESSLVISIPLSLDRICIPFTSAFASPNDACKREPIPCLSLRVMSR